MKKLSALWMIGLVLLSIPALAGDRTIYNGMDLWQTRGDGSTFADFSKESLPAGFFCNKSAPFTGRIVLRGVPLATAQPGALGVTDTLIQRLDNAVFNKRGVATTRIQMRAMQFESLTPLKTACGDFKAYVRLDGEQPITTMRIVRDHEKGGRFFAPISVNIKLVFEPVGRVTTEVWEIRKALRFPPAQLQEWTGRDNFRSGAVNGFVRVDTDSDGALDTFLPGTSNFAAGLSAFPQKAVAISSDCHVEDEGQHCPGGVIYY